MVTVPLSLLSFFLAAPPRASAHALIDAVHICARDESSLFHALPTLGPMQMIAEFVRRSIPRSGVVDTNTTTSQRVWTFNAYGSAQFSPVGVALLDKGTLAVTDSSDNAKCALVDAENRSLVRSVSLRGLAPIGVCVEHANNHICIVDANTRVVKVFSDVGVSLRSFGGPGADNGLFQQPYDVTMNSRNEFFVSDLAQPSCVQQFREDGSFLRLFRAQRVRSARGLCVTSSDDVLVADLHSVFVYRSDAQVVRKLEDFGGLCFMNSTLGFVAVDAVDTVVVSDSRRCSVSVVLLDGTRLRSFGHTGSDVLSAPRGVCVTLDGSVAVCNTGAHRLELWK